MRLTTDRKVPDYIRGRVVAICGYQYEGLAQARWLRENGVEVIVALREGFSQEMWEREGFEIVSIFEAADRADIFQVW